jgi:putative exosortase-associated protein (TIGR04073 family)
MQKAIVHVLLLATVLLWCLPVWSAEDVAPERSVRASERFGRGLANIISSPCELPAQIYLRASYQHEYNNNPFATVGGFLEGIPMGVMYFGWRLTAGCFDLVTFPFARYDAAIIDPEYVSFSYQILLSE